MTDLPDLSADDIARLIADRFPRMSHEEKVALADRMLELVGSEVTENGAFYLSLFDRCEGKGVRIIKEDYNSPIPSSEEIERSVSRDLIRWGEEIDIDFPGQTGFVEDAMKRRSLELLDTPHMSDEPGVFFWDNPMFPVADALAYYTMVREFRPSRILEVGSGYSTLIAAQAARLNGCTELCAIEPYPTQFFNVHLRSGFEGLASLIEKPVQEVDLDLFRSLGANDILFIDSSHMGRAGSDVNFLFFDVLPALADGVIVHIHDIFLPDEYIRTFAVDHKRFFNEQHLLAAYLAHNSNWKTIFASWAYLREHRDVYRTALAELFDTLPRKMVELFDRCVISCTEIPPDNQVVGGSYWMRRLGSS